MQFILICASAVCLKYGLFYYSSVQPQDDGKFSFSLLPLSYETKRK